MTVYDKVRSRSTFIQTLSGNSEPGVLDSPQSLPVSGSRTAIVLPVTTNGELTASNVPAVDLQCPAVPGECQGVYPVGIALERVGSDALVGRLTTYLTYAESTSQTKLRFALVVPFGAPVTIHTTDDPARALGPPSAQTVASLTGLAGSLARSAAPLTVEADPQTLQALRASHATADQALLTTLSDLPAAEQFPGQPYVPIDVGALAGAGLTGEIQVQMAQGTALLRSVVRAGPATWVANGPVGSDLAQGLADAGAHTVVVPDTALTADPGRLGITQTFQLAFARAAPVAAATSDSGLAAHFSADPGDPVLAANQMLADLAFIHYEEPNAIEPRGVIAVPPRGWRADSRFLDALLAGLASNPGVAPVTLAQFFAQVPAGGHDDEPTVRHLAPGSGTGPVVAKAVAQRVAASRIRSGAFDSAVRGTPSVLAQLNDLLLAAESDELSTSRQARGLAIYQACLGAQLAQVQLATDRSITLTARTAPIPVTILSSAAYEMVGDLSLAGDKFQFPQGSTRHDFPISRNTNSVRIVVRARTTGDLPLEVTLTAPQVTPGAPPLVITHGQLTVRSTATSLVGIVLTLAAAAVLLVWWARTWWRSDKRRGRHRRAGSGGTGAILPP